MKKVFNILLLGLLILISACQGFEPYSRAEMAQIEFQKNKLECVCPELAQSTNFYGMGGILTRTTDAPDKAPAQLMHDAWESFCSNYPTDTVTLPGDVFVTTLHLAYPTNEYYYLNSLGASNDGRQVTCTIPECSELIRTKDNAHTAATFVTNGEYTYIITPDSAGFVYLVTDKQMGGYLLCIEDLGGDCLDYNDLVIYGGRNQHPQVIYRMAAYDIALTYDNTTITIPSHFGDTLITLPFNNLNTPNDWKRVSIVADGNINIEPLINNAADQPAIIGTRIDYKFHRDENTMTSDEFKSIPYWK